jgi:hypothetical protein
MYDGSGMRDCASFLKLIFFVTLGVICSETLDAHRSFFRAKDPDAWEHQDASEQLACH